MKTPLKERTQWRIIIALYIVAAFGLGLNIGQAVERSKNEAGQHGIVYGVCQLSRISDTVTERDCADAQALYKIEYLCKEANKSPENFCWTENNNTIERY